MLDDHRVLASVGGVGDCYDNALAESFVDSYKTELIAIRVWRTDGQLELATVDLLGRFGHRRLHPDRLQPAGGVRTRYWGGSRSGSNRSRLRPPKQSPIYETFSPFGLSDPGGPE